VDNTVVQNMKVYNNHHYNNHPAWLNNNTQQEVTVHSPMHGSMKISSGRASRKSNTSNKTSRTSRTSIKSNTSNTNSFKNSNRIQKQESIGYHSIQSIRTTSNNNGSSVRVYSNRNLPESYGIMQNV
jgi:hypothetical protein